MSDRSLTPVRLRGHLGARFGSMVRYLDVQSPAEAIQLLCGTVTGFEDYVRTSPGGYKILLRDAPLENPSEHLSDPTGRQEIRIVPVAHVAKDAMLQVLAGAALIGLAFTPMGATVIAGNFTMGSMMFGMGLSLALGGISQLLVGSPSAQKEVGSSFLFGNSENTIAQGNPVPLCYGRLKIVPPIISTGIDTEAFNNNLFSATYDGVGTWSGNGDTTVWGGSLKAQ